MGLIGFDWIAVIVTTIVAMALGALWYSPALFGKVMGKLTKKNLGLRGSLLEWQLPGLLCILTIFLPERKGVRKILLSVVLYSC